MREYFIFLSIISVLSCRISESVVIDPLQTEYVLTNYKKYKSISKTMVDTLLAWEMDTLEPSKGYLLNKEIKIDSLILFNSDSSRLFTYLLERNFRSTNTATDYLSQLAGARIKGKWYFFFGMSTVIERASYQDSIYAPLTFDELSYLAREHMQGALYRDTDGNIKVRDEWFKFINNRRDWGLPTHSTLEQLDSLIVKKCTDIRLEKIDPIELAYINKEIAASVQPPEPPDTR